MNIANTTFPHVSACASKDIAFLSCTMLHGNSGTHRNAFLSTQLHSSEFNRFRLSCPGISGDAAFLFGSAVECHLELLNFACSVRNGVSCTTQVAKWTLHGHCMDIAYVSVQDLPLTSIVTGRMRPGEDAE